METKKLSKTVQKRLRRKGILMPRSTDAVKKVSEESCHIVQESLTAKRKKKKKKKKKAEPKTEPTAVLEVKSNDKPTVAPTGKRKSDDKPTVAPTGKRKSDDKPTVAGKRHRKHDPKDKVAYINSNYVSNDVNDVGGLIQAELVGLRKQSKDIKSASDLTENQAHVIKRQITKLQGAELERTFKRPKHCDKTINEATAELEQLLQKQKSKLATSK